MIENTGTDDPAGEDIVVQLAPVPDVAVEAETVVQETAEVSAAAANTSAAPENASAAPANAPRILTVGTYDKADYYADNATFQSISGTISESLQKDVYTFTAGNEGTYRFEGADLVEGFKLELELRDEDGYRISNEGNISNGGGMNAKLEAGQVCQLYVKQYSGTGTYRINIGQPKPAQNITGYTQLHDSMEFRFQKNRYYFTSTVDGYYSFGLTEIKNGQSISLYIYDSEGYTKDYENTMEKGEYIATHLEAGKTYTIVASQVTELGSYVITVGYQKPAADISEYDSFTDSTEHRYQRNIYYYTPSRSGTYKFCLSQINSDVNIGSYLYDSEGYKLAWEGWMDRGDYISRNLSAGETYKLVIEQAGGFGSYTMEINPPE